MILIIGPLLIVGALFAIIAPRLFGRLVGIVLALAALTGIYIMDGQLTHPLFPHSYEKSAAVR